VKHLPVYGLHPHFGALIVIVVIVDLDLSEGVHFHVKYLPVYGLHPHLGALIVIVVIVDLDSSDGVLVASMNHCIASLSSPATHSPYKTPASGQGFARVTPIYKVTVLQTQQTH
jgi:hypothetical protein